MAFEGVKEGAADDGCTHLTVRPCPSVPLNIADALSPNLTEIPLCE